MSISGDWRSIEGSEVKINEPIAQDTIQAMLKNLVALYEALLDTTAPNAPSQEYVGHDHGPSGGNPITHGIVAIADRIGSPLVTLTPTGTPSNITQQVTMGAVNYGVWDQRGEILDCWVRCKVVGADFKLSINSSDPITIKPTSDAEPFRWVRMQIPALNGNFYIENIVVAIELAGTATGSSFDLYGMIIAETDVGTTGALRPPPDLSSSIETFSYFDTLETDLAADEEWLHADMMTRLESAINALHECLLDANAPGSSSQYIKGHDHATNGGRPLNMGLVYSMGVDNALGHTVWTPTLTTQNTWYFADQSSTYRRSVGTAGGAATAGMFFAPVSPGVSSSGSPPTTNPSLMARLFVDFSGGAVVECRIRNLTTGTYSETLVLVTTGTNEFLRIPCSGGAWNDFAIELRCTSQSNLAVDILEFVMFEIPYTASGKSAFVDSSGNRILATPLGA